MVDLSLADIRALSEVASCRNFREAAKRLDVSPSALSHTIASIERRLGLRFFNRTTRSVALTEGGAAFLRRAAPSMRDIEAAIHEAKGYGTEPGGLLRINGSEGGLALLIPLISTFLRDYPDVEMDLVIDGELSDIVGLGFDAGLRSAEYVPQDMIAIPVGPDQRFVVVGSPDYFSSNPPPENPADLARHNCVRARLPSGRLIRWEFERLGESLAVPVTGNMIAGSPDLSQIAARNSLGLAYVSQNAARADLTGGRLVQVLDDWTPSYPGLRLYYPRHRLPSATLRAFAAHVRSANRKGV
ncbi:LysR family transcriptional regulator [Roseibium marinum]|uniref:DNA-binding transcriptional LysR family regulator n=1 Tax=Roseibium marinum TaxID=281252 RepID=A0A2S3UW53_9HYPH|nr:LysR family transcriptional regulator [Roseibium marinum]POF31783.1 DNA-binding transcriptional LysR family regulator [Roseibium marinum]